MPSRINTQKQLLVVQHVHIAFSDIKNLARYTLAKVGENSEWTSIVNSAKENTANFCKGLDGKPLFSALYSMNTVTLNELKALQKVSAQTGQSSVVNKTSVESAAPDDYHKVKRRKRHISNNTWQTAKKSTKPVPTSTAVKLPPKAVSTCTFSTPLRTTDMDTETSGAENTLAEQEASRKPGRPPLRIMTSTTNLIRLQSELKDHMKGEYKF
jgi:hypothetical protein